MKYSDNVKAVMMVALVAIILSAVHERCMKVIIVKCVLACIIGILYWAGKENQLMVIIVIVYALIIFGLLGFVFHLEGGDVHVGHKFDLLHRIIQYTTYGFVGIGIMPILSQLASK